MSSFANTSSLTDYVEVANDITDGWLVFGMAVTIFTVLFLSTLAFGKWRALTYSSFVTGIVLVLMNMLGMADYWLIVLDGVAFSIGAFMMMQSKSSFGG